MPYMQARRTRGAHPIRVCPTTYYPAQQRRSDFCCLGEPARWAPLGWRICSCEISAGDSAAAKLPIDLCVKSLYS
jgi:hypothetical protein